MEIRHYATPMLKEYVNDIIYSHTYMARQLHNATLFLYT